MTPAPSNVGAVSVLRVTGPAVPGHWVGTDGQGNVAWLNPPPVAEVVDADVADLLADPTSQTGGHLAATTPSASSGSRTLWVSPTGSDTATGTQAAPLRTLARATSLVPDIIRAGHTWTITLLPGHWAERLDLASRTILGSLVVRGSTNDRYAHTIRDAYARNVVGHYRIENIHSSTTAPGVHFRYDASGPRMELGNVSGTGEVTDVPHSSGNQGVLADYGSTVIVENSRFDYKDYGLRANYGSTIVSRDNTGENNTHGVGARFGGTVHIHGTMPHGYDSITTASSGGVVVHDGGGHVGVQRWNAALGKYDTFGMAEQVTLHGQGHITPIKRWVSRSSTTRRGDLPGDGGRTIPDGSKLRIFFQMTTGISCPVTIDVSAAWMPTTSSDGRRYVKCTSVPLVTATQARHPEVSVLASAGTGSSTAVSIGHTGADGIFYLDFIPSGGAEDGRHGLDIAMSTMRHYDAPIMLGAQVI